MPELLPRAFVDPASVAVVGATEDRAKWGHWLARGALAGSHRRQVWLVNHRATTILGHPGHPRVEDLPGTPELVVLCVPAARLRPVVEAALAKGCRAFLAITAGLGPEHDDIVALLRRSGARLIGPNSLGIFHAATELRLAWGEFTPGSLAVVTQSGQLGSEIAGLGARAGLGVSCFYSVGNQLDLAAVDILEALADDPHTTTVALYLESFAGGERIVAAMKSLRRAGKHVLVLTTGASDGSRRLARSHTGSMTSALDVVDAACRAAGALRVATPAELVGVARVLDAGALPGGRRVAVITDSGGQGAIAADVAAAEGLVTPVLSERLQTRLRELLPASAAVSNPVDLAGAGEADLQVYARLVELVAASGEVDSVLLSGYLGCYGEDTPSIRDAELAVVDRLGHRPGAASGGMSAADGSQAPADGPGDGLGARPGAAFGDASGTGLSARAGAASPLGARPADVAGDRPGRPAGGAGAPLVVHSMSASSAAVARMGEHRIPVFPTVDAALAALGRAIALGARPVREPVAPRPGGEPPAPGYWAARGFLASLGIAMPAAHRVANAVEVAQAAAVLRSPLVLKAGWIEHKSEHDAVRTGLTPDTALAAYQELSARLGPGEYVLEEQDTRRGVVEMLIGARRDRDFGPVVAVGLGGVQAELWRDVALEPAPVDRATATAMLARLRSRALLDGWRGQPAVDVDALVDAIVAVSDALAGTAGIEDIEINPIRVAPDGALAVDALVLARAAAPPQAATTDHRSRIHLEAIEALEAGAPA